MKSYKRLIGPLIAWVLLYSFFPARAGDERSVKPAHCYPLQGPGAARVEEETFDVSRLNAAIRGALGVQAYENVEIFEYFVGDLHRDGQKVFVASINRKCTSDPVGIVVIFKRDRQMWLQEIPTHRGNLLQDLKNLDEDGKYEIIARSVLAETTCHANCVEWHDVYEWSPRGYVQASQKYRDYYVMRYIPSLQRRLAAEQKLNAAEMAQNDKHTKEWWERWKSRSVADCHMGIDKARRLVGEDPKAGLKRALAWLERDDPELRKNAIKVFREIADAASIRALKAASQDENKQISQRAKRALRELGEADLEHIR